MKMLEKETNDVFTKIGTLPHTNCKTVSTTGRLRQ